MKIDKEIINKLFEEQKIKEEELDKIDKVKEELDKINKAINSLQNLCDHDWRVDTTISHRDYYICNICRETKI